MNDVQNKCYVCLLFSLIIGMCLLFVLDSAFAQPVVEVHIEPDLRTLYLDTGIQEILLEARVSNPDVHFTWKLEGPGELLGDLDSPGNIYSLPERIQGDSAQVIITLTVTDQQGYEVTRNLVFQILPLPPSPSPPPTPPPPGLHFLPVPEGTYRLNEYLQRYIHYPGVSSSIVIQQPFSIQAGEVTVGEFRQYLESLKDEYPEQMRALRDHDRDDAPFLHDRPLENISWEEANAYAQWLSQQTGWDLRLPTIQQWAAACVKYAEARPVLRTTENQSVSNIRGDIDHLLGNLREWSSDACENGKYRLLGENYMTDFSDPEVIGKGYCAGADERWSGVGFRLVRIEQ